MMDSSFRWNDKRNKPDKKNFMLITLDGIDGSGKSTVINAWKNYLTNAGNSVFDLKKYWQTNNAYPNLSELKLYDFIFLCEPAYVGIGKVIRDELIKKRTHYPPLAITEAYSLDRLILYTNIIIPLLKENKHVIADRGISSSLAYQTAQGQGLNFENISSLPGNKLALEYRPDYLILMQTKVETATIRLLNRSEKNDNAIFEKLNFQKKLAAIYESPEFKEIFTKRGSKIQTLNGEPKIDIMEQEAVSLLVKILNQ